MPNEHKIETANTHSLYEDPETDPNPDLTAVLRIQTIFVEIRKFITARYCIFDTIFLKRKFLHIQSLYMYRYLSVYIIIQKFNINFYSLNSGSGPTEIDPDTTKVRTRQDTEKLQVGENFLDERVKTSGPKVGKRGQHFLKDFSAYEISN
jgi:hypothetical protein